MSQDIRAATETIHFYLERGDIDAEDFDRILDNYLEATKNGYEVNVEDMIHNYIRAKNLDSRGQDPEHARRGHATILERAVAGVIDLSLIAVVSILVLTSVDGLLRHMSGLIDVSLRESAWTSPVLMTLVAWAYFMVSERSRWLASPGKRLMGLRLVNARGYRLSLIRQTLRFLTHTFCVASWGLGYLVILVTARRQGVHDLVVDSLVVTTDYVPARDRAEEDRQDG